MKKLLESLRDGTHPGGTYAALIPDVATREQIFAFCTSLDIPNLEDQDEYHCTLIYSEVPCISIREEDFGVPCEAMPIEFKILGKDTLVLEIYCPNAARLHDLFKEKHNASHGFPGYIAHITVAKEYSGIPPIELPDFPIIFSGYMIEELS
jgi:hypothetical protein